MGAFDNAGYVGEEDASLVRVVDIAEVRKEGCERIGADFNFEVSDPFHEG